MYQCIYDKTTGKILAICTPNQDYLQVKENYSNCDTIEIAELPNSLRNFSWRIDPVTLELKKI